MQCVRVFSLLAVGVAGVTQERDLDIDFAAKDPGEMKGKFDKYLAHVKWEDYETPVSLVVDSDGNAFTENVGHIHFRYPVHVQVTAKLKRTKAPPVATSVAAPVTGASKAAAATQDTAAITQVPSHDDSMGVFLPSDFACLEPGIAYTSSEAAFRHGHFIDGLAPRQMILRCQRLCADHPGCTHFTLRLLDVGAECAMAGAQTTTRVAAPRHISGPRTCEDAGEASVVVQKFAGSAGQGMLRTDRAKRFGFSHLFAGLAVVAGCALAVVLPLMRQLRTRSAYDSLRPLAVGPRGGKGEVARTSS
jgi:hypothetical protein